MQIFDKDVMHRRIESETIILSPDAYVGAVMKGIEDADAGRVVPHDEVMAQMDRTVCLS